MSSRYLIPSIVIAAVLLAQLAVTAAGAWAKWQQQPFDDTFWPFLDYPMYSEAYGPPVQTSTVRLVAVLPDGREVGVDAAYMGLDYFGWRYQIVERLVAPTPIGRHSHLADRVEADRNEAMERVVDQVESVVAVAPARINVHRRVYTVDDGDVVEHDEVRYVYVEGGVVFVRRENGDPLNEGARLSEGDQLGGVDTK